MFQVPSVFVLTLLTAFALSGCCAPGPRETIERPATMPTYAELVRKHNERVKGIERFWARAVIEVRWVDAEGKNRLEQGEGHLILDLPKESSLTLGKLGTTKLWAGSNDTYYWLFDELEGKKLYLGRHDGKPLDIASDSSQRSSPLPVRPVDIPGLLGILPIDEKAGDVAGQQVKWEETSFVIEPPNQGMRYYFHPVTFRPVRVALLNREDQPVLVSELNWPERIALEKAPVGPYINTRIAVSTPGQPGSMTLFLSEMTDAPTRVNPKVFDLDFLRNMMKPEQVIAIEAK